MLSFRTRGLQAKEHVSRLERAHWGRSAPKPPGDIYPRKLQAWCQAKPEGMGLYGLSLAACTAFMAVAIGKYSDIGRLRKRRNSRCS